MPAYSRDWGDATGSETLLAAAARNLVPIDKSHAQPGDILVFRMVESGVAKHAGIMMSAQSFIHSQEGLGTVEAELIKWCRRRLVAAYAFPEVN